jgi:hypothetical protein
MEGWCGDDPAKAASRRDTLGLYSKYTFYLYSERTWVLSKRLIFLGKIELASPTGFEPVLPP